ncbi:MAG TPA: efflux RND transporter permease subunit, partial [Myxococcota bacterium]|nr:efflux RND transporter permease subunit [Myxococcota bacterium]
RNLEQGKSTDTAAALGPEEVQGAVTAATLTNAAIFMPVLFVGGMIGIFFTELAYVIIVTLAISLLVALALVPVLARRFLRNVSMDEDRRGGFFRFSERQLRRLEAGYGRLIGVALRNRKKTLAVAVLLFAASLGLTAVIGVDFMPLMDGGMMIVTVELPIGANADRTFAVAQQVEGIIQRRIPEALVTFVRAGASSSGLSSLMGGRSGPNLASIMVRVPKRSERERTTFDMAEAIRDEVLAIPGPVSVQIDASNPMAKMTTSGGKPLTLEVFSSSDDMQEMRAVTRHIEALVKGTPGAINVSTDTLDDNPELQLAIRRMDAARLGVPVAMIAAAVRTSMYGNAVTRYRGGDEDIDLFLKLRDEDRGSVADITSLTVPSLSGAQIRLDSIASVVDGSSPLEIRRMDMQRQLRVMADVSGRALGDVAADVERQVAADRAAGVIPDTITTRFAGDVKEQRAMVVDMTLALLLAIFLVYMVMAAQFESLLDPFVVMFSVPFGITGALVALPLTGTTISLTSFVGLIMTVGVVVKNAIVLVDYINLMRARGMGLEEALRTGGERRLRPVLMTALAILGGMLPLALSSGEGSEIWRPMGVAVIGGVLVSTLVTLVLIPCVYSLTDRWRARRGAERAPRPSPA